MSELDETLNRRRKRSEVAGAVFEAKSQAHDVADITWEENTPGQFTPRTAHSPPRSQHFREEGDSILKGKGLGKGRRASGGDLARMESPEGLRQQRGPFMPMPAREPYSPGRGGERPSEGEEYTEFAPPAPVRSSPTWRTKEQEPPAEAPGVLRVGEELLRQPHWQQPRVAPDQRDSEMSRATVDAGAVDMTATAPASPANSASNLPTTSDGRSVRSPQGTASGMMQPAGTASESLWAPTPLDTGLRPPARTEEREEKPAMSSSSYFRPYMRQQRSQQALSSGPSTPTPAAAPANFDSFSQPFPKDKDAVLQKKLREASGKVRSLCDSVSTAMTRPRMHPVELQEILKVAESVQASTRLSDEELECIGWPTKVLRQMREIITHMATWQRCEDEAKRTIEEGKALLPAVVKALEGILVAWSHLSSIEHGPLHVDPGLQRRCASTVPLISALLDQTMVLVRRKPDVFIMRQLEALLRHSVANHPLKELGVKPHFMQALHELDESVQGLPANNIVANGNCLAAPEVVWRAVVDGDVETVSKIINQGGLVSGRTCDSKGHSVLWDAIAFNNPEVALLILRNFPPDMPYGVNLGELHPRNGNSLLHLASALQSFTPQAEGLFAMLFERMPEGLRLHRNSRGQTFLHLAAGRLHTLVLKFAAVRGLDFLFDTADSSGWTPRKVLAQRLAELKVASDAPRSPDVSRARLPSWCPLAALQPPGGGSKPLFSDMCVEVQDETKGTVVFHAHCAILGGCSHVLNRELRMAVQQRRQERIAQAAAAAAAAAAAGEEEPAGQEKIEDTLVKLKLDPKVCRSLDVAIFAIRFLYTGELECTFQANANLLLQLVRFCTIYSLPSAVRDWALCALLETLGASDNGPVAVALTRQAEELGMAPYERCFVARRLFGSDDSWTAIPEEERGKVLDAALDALEPYAQAAMQQTPEAPQAAMGTMPLGPGMGALPGTGVLGTQSLDPPVGTGMLPCSAPYGMPPGSGPLGPPMGSGMLHPSASAPNLGSGCFTPPVGSGMLRSASGDSLGCGAPVGGLLAGGLTGVGPGPMGSGPLGPPAMGPPGPGPLGSGALGSGPLRSGAPRGPMGNPNMMGGRMLPTIQEAPNAPIAVPTGGWW